MRACQADALKSNLMCLKFCKFNWVVTIMAKWQRSGAVSGRMDGMDLRVG